MLVLPRWRLASHSLARSLPLSLPLTCDHPPPPLFLIHGFSSAIDRPVSPPPSHRAPQYVRRSCQGAGCGPLVGGSAAPIRAMRRRADEGYICCGGPACRQRTRPPPPHTHPPPPPGPPRGDATPPPEVGAEAWRRNRCSRATRGPP